MIKKETLHPKNNPQDDIYPKTSIDQVEGLSGELLEINNNLSSVDDSLDDIEETLPLKADKSNTYTKTEIDSKLALKENKSDLDNDIENFGYRKVVANPTEIGTNDLIKLKVGNTVFNIPSGGGSNYLHQVRINTYNQDGQFTSYVILPFLTPITTANISNNYLYLKCGGQVVNILSAPFTGRAYIDFQADSIRVYPITTTTYFDDTYLTITDTVTEI